MSSNGALDVITYQAIDYRPSVTSLSPELFRWQMETLAARGGLQLRQFLRDIKQVAGKPGR